MNTEFFLALQYDVDTKELRGRAKLRVSVNVAFFSTSVTLGPIEKRFAGGGSPKRPASRAAVATAPTPGVSDLFAKSDWDDPAVGYCALFAPAAFA